MQNVVDKCLNKWNCSESLNTELPNSIYPLLISVELLEKTIVNKRTLNKRSVGILQFFYTASQGKRFSGSIKKKGKKKDNFVLISAFCVLIQWSNNVTRCIHLSCFQPSSFHIFPNLLRFSISYLKRLLLFSLSPQVSEQSNN